MPELTNVPLNKIRSNPFQPREFFDREKIQELADSIKEVGLLQPIIVRKTENSYQIIAGERRWRAAQFAELAEIPCIVLDADDTQSMELSIIENWHRQNLDSMETENFLSELYEKGSKDGRYESIYDMSRKTGIPRTTLQELISAHQQRKDMDAKFEVTYKDIIETKPLEEEPELRKKVLKLRENDKIKSNELRDFSKTLKNASPVIKEALLLTSISIEEAKLIDTELTTPQEKERVIKYLKSERTPERATLHIELLRKVNERKEAEADNIETATGDIWLCPVCNKKYRLIHVDPTGNHKLEEMKE